MKVFTRCFTVAALVACLHSCDSPELVRKRDQQSLEITKLKGELAILEEKLKDVPPDRSKELATIEEEAKIQQEEISRLEGEIQTLEAKKASVQKEFEEYKRKYAIR